MTKTYTELEMAFADEGRRSTRYTLADLDKWLALYEKAASSDQPEDLIRTAGMVNRIHDELEKNKIELAKAKRIAAMRAAYKGQEEQPND